jgi:hypothetical protein
VVGRRMLKRCAAQLNPGDFLVAFTDGISEAMNLAEAKWAKTV